MIGTPLNNPDLTPGSPASKTAAKAIKAVIASPGNFKRKLLVNADTRTA